MSARARVLFVLTSHSQLGTTGKKTGWYLPEFAHPYGAVSKVADISVASPKGGIAPVDEGSVTAWIEKDDESKSFWETKSHLWKQTEKLSNFLGRVDEFSAIFYVGGHGPMWDIATDETSIQLIQDFYENGKVVGAICHGSAALINAKLSDGSYFIKDTPVTGFSNAEEDQIQLSEFMPFMLETELNVRSGGKYEKAAEPWGEKVVVSKGGKLITGQNPGSANALGRALAAAITA